MKWKLFIFALLITFSTSKAQLKKSNTEDLTQYIISQVLVSDIDSGNVVLIHLASRDIKHDVKEIKVHYWDKLSNYYPDIPKEKLQNMVDQAEWLDTTVKIPRFQLHFKKARLSDKSRNAKDVSKNKENFKAGKYIFSVSSPMYSKDGNKCILFVIGYQMGAYTVEISKNSSGKWGYKNIFGEWLE